MTDEHISRHRTAIHRSDLPRLIRLAMQDNIISPEAGVLDYGCGHGDDIAILARRGHATSASAYGAAAAALLDAMLFHDRERGGKCFDEETSGYFRVQSASDGRVHRQGCVPHDTAGH